jgi:hypothetical protein
MPRYLTVLSILVRPRRSWTDPNLSRLSIFARFRHCRLTCRGQPHQLRRNRPRSPSTVWHRMLGRRPQRLCPEPEGRVPSSTPPRSGPAIVPTRPAPNAQPAPFERMAGGKTRPDSELIPAWQPPPIPAPQMTTESNQNGGSNNPIESTHRAPNASPQVNTRSIPTRSTTGATTKGLAITPRDGVIGRPSLWIAEDFGCCASG